MDKLLALSIVVALSLGCFSLLGNSEEGSCGSDKNEIVKDEGLGKQSEPECNTLTHKEKAFRHDIKLHRAIKKNDLTTARKHRDMADLHSDAADAHETINKTHKKLGEKSECNEFTHKEEAFKHHVKIQKAINDDDLTTAKVHKNMHEAHSEAAEAHESFTDTHRKLENASKSVVAPEPEESPKNPFNDSTVE